MDTPNPTDRISREIGFRDLLEAAPDAIIVTSEEGRIAVVNAQAEKIFGYRREELLGQEIDLLVPERFRGQHPAHRESFAAENRTRPMGIGLQLYARRKDSTEVPVEISLSPLRTAQGTLICSVIRDVTSRKEMEAQLEASRMQVISSARLSALGMMAGGLAHEINNPLGIIHAYASNLLEMAQDGQVSIPALESTSTHIKETAERIGSIVKSLRYIAREGDGDPMLPASMRDLVERVLELSRERFRMHSIELICAPIDPHLQVPCREVQISQVLMNLVQNAFDAVVEGSGEKWVKVDVSTLDNSVVVSVSDSGPGVPPAIRARIMEPFFTTKPVGKGTGLGLSISRSIAAGHGGDLTLCQRNGYTCFALTLPRPTEVRVCN